RHRPGSATRPARALPPRRPVPALLVPVRRAIPVAAPAWAWPGSVAARDRAEPRRIRRPDDLGVRLPAVPLAPDRRRTPASGGRAAWSLVGWEGRDRRRRSLERPGDADRRVQMEPLPGRPGRPPFAPAEVGQAPDRSAPALGARQPIRLHARATSPRRGRRRPPAAGSGRPLLTGRSRHERICRRYLASRPL